MKLVNCCVLGLVTTSWINDGAYSYGPVRLLLFMKCKSVTKSHERAIAMRPFKSRLLLYAFTLIILIMDIAVMLIIVSEIIASYKRYQKFYYRVAFHSIVTFTRPYTSIDVHASYKL